MQRLFCICFLSLVLVTAFSAPSLAQKAADYYDMGNKSYQNGNFTQAIVDFTKSIEIEPSPRAYSDRGAAYMMIGEPAKAFPDFDKAIEIGPNNAQAYYKRGVAYNTLGNNNDAIADYTKMLQLELDNTEGLSNRGVSYFNIGEYDKAIIDLSRAIELVPLETNPSQLSPYMNRAKSYILQGDYDKAIADLDIILKVQPKAAGALALRKDVIMLKGARVAKKGEVFSQKDGLFKLALPQGWRWGEGENAVMILSPSINTLGMRIDFAPPPSGAITAANVKEKLKEANQAMIRFMIKPSKGEVIADKEIEMSGAYGRRMDFSIPGSKGPVETSIIYLFHKDKLFGITYVSNNKEDKPVLEGIVQTLEFPKGRQDGGSVKKDN